MANDFATTLEDGLFTLIKTAVGTPDSKPENYVKTFDHYLHDIEITQYPFIALSVLMGDEQGQEEIGTQRDLWIWQVHIYYIDIIVAEGNYFISGRNKRANIIQRIKNKINSDRRLGHIEYTDNLNVREYVYDTHVTHTLYDSSGQEGHYAFVSEVTIEVYTAKT